MSVNSKEIKWENRKKIGYPPNPPRSGCTMAIWPSKGMGVLFGGVSDVDKDEEQLESEFYSDMFVFTPFGVSIREVLIRLIVGMAIKQQELVDGLHLV
jgi:hypothetical protein